MSDPFLTSSFIGLQMSYSVYYNTALVNGECWFLQINLNVTGPGPRFSYVQMNEAISMLFYASDSFADIVL